MNINTSYPFLPSYFPELVACALHMLGVHRAQAEIALRAQLPEGASLPEDDTDPLCIEICMEDGNTVLLLTFDLQKQCDHSFLFLRGPVPQLGDCVYYFNAYGEYKPNKSCWKLQEAIVTLDKTDDEVCCKFSLLVPDSN